MINKNCNDILEQAWLISKRKAIEKYLDYCTERNKKDGWTEETVNKIRNKEKLHAHSTEQQIKK